MKRLNYLFQRLIFPLLYAFSFILFKDWWTFKEWLMVHMLKL